MQVKIYCLIDPLTLKVRYIGRTTKSILKHRLTEHVCKSINKHKYSNYPKTHKENWISFLHDKGLVPIIRQLITVEGWKESYIVESFLINKYQKRLLNHLDRGEGSISPVSENQRKRISNTLKRRYATGEIKKQGEKTFYVYDEKGNFLFERTNIKKTSIELNYPENSLSKMLNGKSKMISKYLFSFIKTDKLEHSLKNTPCVYVYDTENKEICFKNSKEAMQFYNINYTELSICLKGKKLNNLTFSRTKINNFIYKLKENNLHYKLSNEKEEFIFYSMKEIAEFLGLKHKNPCLKKLKCRIDKLNFKYERCPFRE
jgi:hypothetical protein